MPRQWWWEQELGLDMLASSGLTSDGLLLDQHSWQVVMGAPGPRDATGSSRQMVPISTDVPFHEQEGVAGGWKFWGIVALQ
jgi:hypothetical protein